MSMWTWTSRGQERVERESGVRGDDETLVSFRVGGWKRKALALAASTTTTRQRVNKEEGRGRADALSFVPIHPLVISRSVPLILSVWLLITSQGTPPLAWKSMTTIWPPMRDCESATIRRDGRIVKLGLELELERLEQDKQETYSRRHTWTILPRSNNSVHEEA